MPWPSPEPTTLTVHGGPRSVLSLPRRTPSEIDAALRPFEEARSGTPLAHETTVARGGGRGGGRRGRRDLSRGETEIEFGWRPSGPPIPATGTEPREDHITPYRRVAGEALA